MDDIPQDKFIIFGNNPRAVLRKLRERKSGVNNYEGDTPVKLGLILDGGGMRSIVGGGILVALHEFGFNNIFDYVYGSSAGAIAGAYFLSGQCPYGISMYYEDINNANFISFKRGIPFFNIDYLIDVVKYKKCLDVDAIKKSSSELIMSSTEIESGKIRFFNAKENIDLFLSIKASCALPLYYDKPVEIEGKYYLDGAMGGLVPILTKAIEDGCTDILIILNKPKHHRDYVKKPIWLDFWRLKWYFSHFQTITHHNNYNKLIPLIEGRDQISTKVNIAAIAPVAKHLNLATRDTQKLIKAYYKSYTYGHTLLQNMFYDTSSFYIPQFRGALQPYSIGC